VGDRIRAGRARDFHQALRDQRPGDRGAEQVLAFVHGVGPEHRVDEIAHELLAQVLDEDLLHPELPGLAPRGRELLALADVGGEGDDFAAVAILQPLEDDRGVEPAGIGEHDFLYAGLFHCRP
jgi:hypothetical protein